MQSWLPRRALQQQLRAADCDRAAAAGGHLRRGRDGAQHLRGPLPRGGQHERLLSSHRRWVHHGVSSCLHAIRIGNEKWWPIHIAWIVCFWPKKESEMDKLWPWWPTLSEKSGLWKKGALPGSPRYRLSDDLYIFYCNLLPPFVVCHYESWCTSWLPDLHIFCNLSIL